MTKLLKKLTNRKVLRSTVINAKIDIFNSFAIFDNINTHFPKKNSKLK